MTRVIMDSDQETEQSQNLPQPTFKMRTISSFFKTKTEIKSLPKKDISHDKENHSDSKTKQLKDENRKIQESALHEIASSNKENFIDLANSEEKLTKEKKSNVEVNCNGDDTFEVKMNADKKLKKSENITNFFKTSHSENKSECSEMTFEDFMKNIDKKNDSSHEKDENCEELNSKRKDNEKVDILPNESQLNLTSDISSQSQEVKPRQKKTITSEISDGLNEENSESIEDTPESQRITSFFKKVEKNYVVPKKEKDTFSTVTVTADIHTLSDGEKTINKTYRSKRSKKKDKVKLSRSSLLAVDSDIELLETIVIEQKSESEDESPSSKSHKESDEVPKNQSKLNLSSNGFILKNSCKDNSQIDSKTNNKRRRKLSLGRESKKQKIETNNDSSKSGKIENRKKKKSFSTPEKKVSKSAVKKTNGRSAEKKDDLGSMPTTPKSVSKRQRLTCGECDACIREDCGTCGFCLDKPKFGGNNLKKQKCELRRCLLLTKKKNTSQADENVSSKESTPNSKKGKNDSASNSPIITKRRKGKINYDTSSSTTPVKNENKADEDVSSPVTPKRKMCGHCNACKVTRDCGKCTFCKDMKKFGGPYTLRKKCKLRQCVQLN